MSSSRVMKPSLFRSNSLNSAMLPPFSFHSYSVIWPSPSVSQGCSQAGRYAVGLMRATGSGFLGLFLWMVTGPVFLVAGVSLGPLGERRGPLSIGVDRYRSVKALY